MALKRTLLTSVACFCGLPAVALDLPSITAPDRTMPSLGDGEVAINRVDRSLLFAKVDGSMRGGCAARRSPSPPQGGRA